MSAEPSQHTLDDFLEFLALLARAGIPFTVIGGCAVGFYARQLKHPVFSNDVDLCTSSEGLQAATRLARTNAATLTISKVPQPGKLPTLVLHWRNNLEINILTHSDGLPAIDTLLARSSEYDLPTHDGVKLLIADPCDLLANKRRINRPKDAPHIPILEQFIRTRAIAEFRNPSNPERTRIAFVREYMAATNQSVLAPADVPELVPYADAAELRRFLISNAPDQPTAAQIVQRGDPSESSHLWQIYYKSRPR